MKFFDYSKGVIESYCDNPRDVSPNILRSALRDAQRYYKNGMAIKDWLEYIEQTLTPYIKQTN